MTDEKAIKELYLIWCSLDHDNHHLSERLDKAVTYIKNRMKALREIEWKYKELCE